MASKRKILKIVGASLAGLVLLVLIAAVIAVQTNWFRNFVREKIIATTEESTGGRVDIQSFEFDLWHLRAALNGFVLHGTEPKNAPPLLSANRLQVDIRLFSGLKKTVDVRSLIIDQPRGNVIVNPDGTTNVPAPKVKKPSDTSALETIVDLAIGHFELNKGSLLFADKKMVLDARGENLRAQLDFNHLKQNYQGQVAIAPLLLTYGHNRPLNIDVTLPVTLEKDRIGFDNAKIATADSQLTLSGAVDHLVSPRISGHANAKLALAELERATGMKVSAQAAKKLPEAATADVAFEMADNRIQVSGLHVAVGESTIEASGTLQDPSGNPPGLDFKTHLALGELAPLLNSTARPDGAVNVNGNAKLGGSAGYQIAGNIQAKGLSFTQGGQRFSNVNLASAIAADQNRVALNGFRLDALGGQFSGNAAVENMERFRLDGQMRNFDLNTLSRTFMGKPLGYAGVVSGPVKAEGNLKAPGTTGIQANAQLSIAPHGNGVPVSGRINALYNGANDTVQLADTFLALPHSRLELAGNLGQQVNLQFRSSDLNDFLPAMRATSKEPVDKLPVALQNGTASFTGAITGALTAPQLHGHLAVNNFSVEGRKFDQLAADVAASKSGANLQNAQLTRGGMQIQASANIGLRDWKALPSQPLNLNTTIRNGDVADLLALAGQPKVPITGTLNADVHLGGTVANPVGSANATVTDGVAYDQPFQQAKADIGFTNQRVTLSSAAVTTPGGTAQLSGTFDHPAESFSAGTIQARMSTNQIQLGQLQAIDKNVPGLSGSMQANAQLSASLKEVKKETEFQLNAVNADLNIRGLKAEGQNYGDLTATANTTGSTVEYRVNSDLAGSNIRVNGRTELRPDYPTTADASIQSLPMERLLVLAGRKDIPARGMLSGTAKVSGTVQNPNATVDLALAKAVVYDEPLDSVAVRATYTDRLIDVPRLEIVDGAATIQGSLNYSHAPNDLEDGQAKFQLTSTGVSLAQIRNVQKYRPGLAGTLQLMANGAATVRKQSKGSPEVLFSTLDANVNATGLAVNRQKLGDLRLAATTSGDRLSYKVNSDLAGSKIEGHGETTLKGDYVTTAQLSLANVTYSGLRPLLSQESSADPLFEAVADAQIAVNGPVLKTEAMSARFSVSRLEVTTKNPPGSGLQNVALKNDSPIVIALDRSMVRVEHARIVGPDTNIVLAGTAGIQPGQALDLSLNANTNIGLLQRMSRDIYSSGAVVLQAAVRGTMAKPQVNGRLELKDASMNYIEFPNGISKANGLILFNGNSATIQSLTAESGGGKLGANGFVSYGGPALAYGLKATAESVRVRYPPGASIVASAQVNLTGTSQRSLLAGTATIDKLGFSPKSDFGSMLSSSSQPAQAPSAPSGPIAGMRLNVLIRTSPSVTFETSLAQNLQATANLRLRGTLEQPGMIGRVTITEGDLVFFGSKYTVNQGSINFYEPNRIQPVLNIDLETVAKGVTVDLNVSGPIDNMKLTHRSDPPLQFNEIVALLATGRTPTSDPNLVAQQPATPPQSLQQMGESAIVSQAIANPVASRLQRVFGVSQLKIDPTFTSGSELPQARLTLQQQISSNITFTYITNVTQTNSQIIRVEWAVNPQWSAIATREETGRFGIDLFYKKSFR